MLSMPCEPTEAAAGCEPIAEVDGAALPYGASCWARLVERLLPARCPG
jgi:hypothetical protein